MKHSTLPHCCNSGFHHSKSSLTTSVISYVAVVLVQAFEGALGRLEKHGRRHAAQLRDRAALNHLAAEANPFKEALSLASVSLPLPYPSENSDMTAIQVFSSSPEVGSSEQIILCWNLLLLLLYPRLGCTTVIQKRPPTGTGICECYMRCSGCQFYISRDLHALKHEGSASSWCFWH